MSDLMINILAGFAIAESVVITFAVIWIMFCVSNLVDKLSETVANLNRFYSIHYDEVVSSVLAFLRRRPR